MTMTTGTPALSIGLPVRNGEDYLADTLRCLLAQTFTDFEIVLSDNASTDRTQDICESFAARDRRIRYYRQRTNVGASKNFNEVFELSRAPLFKWVTYDDLYHPTFLEKTLEALLGDKGAVLAYSKTNLIDASDKELPFHRRSNSYFDSEGRSLPEMEPPRIAEGSEPRERFHDVLQHVNWCFPIFGVMRSDQLRKTSLHGSYYGCDKVLLAELALLGRFRKVNEVLLHYRFHPGTGRLLTWRQRQRFVDPNIRVLLPAYHTFKGYLKAPRLAARTPVERLLYARSIFGMFLRPGLLDRVLRPGPRYYVGQDVAQ